MRTIKIKMRIFGMFQKRWSS